MPQGLDQDVIHYHELCYNRIGFGSTCYYTVVPYYLLKTTKRYLYVNTVLGYGSEKKLYIKNIMNLIIDERTETEIRTFIFSDHELSPSEKVMLKQSFISNLKTGFAKDESINLVERFKL
jgi:hypothetical protein